MAGHSQSGLWAGMLVTNPRDAEGFERDYRRERANGVTFSKKCSEKNWESRIMCRKKGHGPSADAF